MTTEAVHAVSEMVHAHEARHGAPVVVGVAGAVAIGKTTFAESLQRALITSPTPKHVEVVATDGFLLSNAVLSRRDLHARKGFPESYDTAGLRDFVAAIRAGRGAVVPVYSHDTYDIVAGEERVVAPADVVIIEGVNALGALAGLLDVAVYLEAAEPDVQSWYVTRFHELRAAARDDPQSFYRGFAAMTDDDADAIARQVWRDVNVVNLRDHIEPSRAHAHCVVLKAGDHSVKTVTVRQERGGSDAVRPDV